MPYRMAIFLFKIVEVKSEVCGGTLFNAENQAVGSGSSYVEGMLWLYQEVDKSFKGKGKQNKFSEDKIKINLSIFSFCYNYQ